MPRRAQGETVTVSSPAASATLGQMLLDAAQRHRGVALHYRRDDQTISISYPQIAAIVTEIARGLIAGAVVAPIYDSNAPEECAYVLAHSGARLVFCQDAAQAAKIAEISPASPRRSSSWPARGRASGAVTRRGLSMSCTTSRPLTSRRCHASTRRSTRPSRGG